MGIKCIYTRGLKCIPTIYETVPAGKKFLLLVHSNNTWQLLAFDCFKKGAATS